jgi:protein O-GlcNAc transferase
LKDKLLIKEAMHCYVTAIRIMPTFAPAHSNLASVFKEQGKITQAVAHYKEAIAIDPSFADAYSNLGNVYKDINHTEEAIECYEMAIRIRPDYAEAYANLAATLKDNGKLLEAVDHYRKALDMKPNFYDAYANLMHAMMTVCDWTNYDEHFQRLSNELSTQLGGLVDGINDGHHGPWMLPSVQPFHALAYPLSLSELQLIAHRYAQRAKQNMLLESSEDSLRFTFTPKPRYARLHIGYVSSDFGNHPLSHLMQSVFGSHDRSKFQVTCYALTPSDQSPWRDKIEAEVEHFKDISSLTAGEAAQLIHADKVHILINLNGYTRGARNEIFALRPAPIQVSYLGFCGTMGADYIDYMIADATTIPAENKSYYSEKILTMPHSYFVNDHRQSSRQVVNKVDMPTRRQYNISEDAFVFCNFNQVLKIDPKIFDIWMNILKRVPNAVLWLLRFPSLAEENLRKEARKRGIQENQIIFTDVAPRDEHIKRGFLADLFLDTPLYNAHTTGCDILWSGTPIITLPGDKMASRVAASLLQASGLKELVVSSYAEYEELAVALALDPHRLYSMRMHLEANRDQCPCFDTTRWVKNYESGLQSIWKRRESGLAPDHVVVEDSEPVIFKDAHALL